MNEGSFSSVSGVKSRKEGWGSWGGCLWRRQKHAEYLGRRWRCWERCQALHTQMLSDVWTKTDEQRPCSETRFSAPHSDPQPDSRERLQRKRERAPHCRDRNPERKLGTAEVRGGRCCQTLHRDQGCGGSTPEGRMKKEPLPLVRGAGAVQGSREPRSSLKAHTEEGGVGGGEESVGVWGAAGSHSSNLGSQPSLRPSELLQAQLTEEGGRALEKIFLETLGV